MEYEGAIFNDCRKNTGKSEEDGRIFLCSFHPPVPAAFLAIAPEIRAMIGMYPLSLPGFSKASGLYDP